MESNFDTLLGEKGRMALYNAGGVQVLASGEPLLLRDQRAPGMSLVLNGSIEVLTNGGSRSGLVFHAGDLINEEALFDSDPSISSLVADEQSRALVLDKVSFNALSPDIQVVALKHVSSVYSARMMEMNKALEIKSFQRGALTANLAGGHPVNRKKYEQSELILNLLNRITRLPLHMTQLIELLMSENASAKSVTDLARQDPSLVGEVLKEVNSAAYGARQKVSDLNYAIMLIGFNEVYQLVLSTGIRKTMPDTESFRNIHLHSMVMSCLCGEVCRLCDRHSISLLGTIGLLHEIGRSTVLLIEKENPKLSFFIQMLDPSITGAMLLRKWNLPEVICETIEYQHFAKFAPPSELPTQFQKSVGILHIAHAIADRVIEKKDAPAEYPFINEYSQACGLGNIDVDQIQEAIVRSLKARAGTIPAELKKCIFNNGL